MPEGLAVLIPTRNRPELARRAIASVAGASPRVQVFVSDNSTAPGSREELSSWLRVHHPDVTLFHPSEEMPMSAHWDWALKKVMSATTASHIAILTDRMRFRRYGLPVVLAALDAAPDRIVSYRFDTIDDWDEDRVRVELMHRTRRAYRLDTLRVLDWVSQWHGWEVPTPLNSAFPVAVFEQMAASRADDKIFCSLAPDYYVGFKALVTVPDFVVCDDGVLVHFGLRQSNGHAISSGVANDHSRDFFRLAGGGPVLNSPYPAILTTDNCIVHEYNVVRDEVGHDAMPEMERAVVRKRLAREARQMRDPTRRREVLEMLDADSAPTAEPGSMLSTARSRFRHLLTVVRRHQLGNLRIVMDRIGLTAVLFNPRTPVWGRFLQLILDRRPAASLGRAARWFPVEFPTLDAAITAVEDLPPSTAGSARPLGVISEMPLTPSSG